VQPTIDPHTRPLPPFHGALTPNTLEISMIRRCPMWSSCRELQLLRLETARSRTTPSRSAVVPVAAIWSVPVECGWVSIVAVLALTRRTTPVEAGVVIN